jgi:hypothetical protein
LLVAWDTLEAPTYRHTAFKAYQGGRDFDAALLEQPCSDTRVRQRLWLRERQGRRI